MIDQGEYIGVADTAKLIRQSLKHNFPGIKFSVRSKSYAGGASVTVDYDDGPALERVEAVAKRFEGASFDGMTDSKSYHDTAMISENGEAKTVHMGADYVFVNRHLSWPVNQKLAYQMAEYWGFSFDGSEVSFQTSFLQQNGSCRYLSSVVWQESRKLDF